MAYTPDHLPSCTPSPLPSRLFSSHASVADQDAPSPAGVREFRPRLSARRRTGLVCLFMALCLLALLTPAVYRAFHTASSTVPSAGLVMQSLCQVMVNTGLPPTDQPLWSLVAAETDSTSDTSPVRDPASDTEDGHTVQTGPETESPTPIEVPSTGASSSDSPGEAPTEPGTEIEIQTQTLTVAVPEDTLPTEPVTEPLAGPTGTEADTDPEASNSLPSSLQDMSESQRGPTYLWNDTVRDPYYISAPWAYTGTEEPVVLLVSSHPFEGYGDEGSGTVSDLADRLAEELRARGISVVLVNSAMSGLTPDTSLRETYTRTQALVKYYCRIYNDICLVLDLRRSSETAQEGVLLATDGQVGGQSCAQIRLIADALRSGDTEGADLSFALTLRQALWDISPTLSRPVWWRAGQGLLPCQTSPSGESGPVLLTVELGAAGDTYDRAAATIPYLGQALAQVLKATATPQNS